MNIGKMLKLWRTKSGFSQQELADRAGVGRTTIAMLEAGKQADITTTTCRALAGALGIPPSALLWEPGTEKEGVLE